MKRRPARFALTIFLCAAMVVISSGARAEALQGVATSAVASPRAGAEQPPATCVELGEYLSEVAIRIDEVKSTWPDRLRNGEIGSWAQDDYVAAWKGYFEIMMGINRINPPALAEVYNDLLVQRMLAFGLRFESVAFPTRGDALDYDDKLKDLDVEIAEEALELEVRCGIPIYDHDGDGIDEVGLGNASGGDTRAIGDTPAALGSRFNPLPIGTETPLVKGLAITVIGVMPDGTNLVLAENKYNDTPAPNHQFFIARVRVAHTGGDIDGFYLSRLRAIGDAANGYSQYQDNCDMIPDPLSDHQLVSGGAIEGNICWSVLTSDVDSLVIFDRDANETERVYLSLVPNGPGDILAESPVLPTSQPSPTAAPSPCRTPSPSRTPSPLATAATDVVIKLEVNGFRFQPNTIMISVSEEPVILHVTNSGCRLLTLAIEALAIEGEVFPGESLDILIPVGTASGSYELIGQDPEYPLSRMIATLIVR